MNSYGTWKNETDEVQIEERREKSVSKQLCHYKSHMDWPEIKPWPPW
jgi:hypothetical protein